MLSARLAQSAAPSYGGNSWGWDSHSLGGSSITQNSYAAQTFIPPSPVSGYSKQLFPQQQNEFQQPASSDAHFATSLSVPLLRIFASIPRSTLQTVLPSPLCHVQLLLFFCC